MDAGNLHCTRPYCLAVNEGDIDAAVQHAENWLALKAADRYIWRFVDDLKEFEASIAGATIGLRALTRALETSDFPSASMPVVTRLRS
jgi:hypothetical protein